MVSPSALTAMPKQPSPTFKPLPINWKCLNESDDVSIAPQKPPYHNLPKAQMSFAQALTNICDTPSSQLPKPTIKGDKFSISIPDEEYDLGMEACKNNLHARIIWPKGSSPLTVVALKEKLKPVWKNLAPWGVTSIGKGFYEFVFSSVEDARRVRSVGSWMLNPGLLKLFPWTKDFSPNLQTNTSAQVWLKIHGLAQEYWRKRIIFAIASSVGTPICVDSVTSKPAIERTFGHFARVLIDIDLSKELRYEVLVERKGYAFFVELEYENVPEFCVFCKTVGHSVSVCRKASKGSNDGNHQDSNKGEPNDKVNKDKVPFEKRNGVWMEKEKLVIDLDNENSDKQASQHAAGAQENVEASQLAAGAQENVESMKEGTQKTQQLEMDENNNNSPVAALNRHEGTFSDGEESEDSSQASEFVDATQLNNDVEEEQDPSQEQDPNLRSEKDIQFLKQSWGNLAEVDEEVIKQQEADLVAKLANEADIDAQIQQENQINMETSGFKLVTRRSSKKNSQKTNNAKASSSYLTRSKVPTKPFK